MKFLKILPNNLYLMWKKDLKLCTVLENKLDFVQNVISREDCFKDVTPEPSNLIQANKSEDEGSMTLLSLSFPKTKPSLNQV